MSFKTIAEFLALTGEDAPTTAEKKLIEATKAGLPCVLCDPDDPSCPTEATDATSIRASLVRLLITGSTKHCGLHARGVTLVGGWIEDTLDLACCTAQGQSSLNHCHFAARPNFAQARFKLLSLSRSVLSKGLVAHGIGVKDSFLLRSVIASGTVDMKGAKIGGQIDCEGACFDCGTDSQEALNAQGVEAGRDLLLVKVTAIGTVSLEGARIGGRLDCEHSSFKIRNEVPTIPRRALNAQQMRVSGAFFFRDIAGVEGQIILTAAHVGDLVDDAASWPNGKDRLNLDGFIYNRIGSAAPTTLAERQDWLTASAHWKGKFRPQPYTQLARVLRQMGHAGEARKVLIERESLLGKARRAARRQAAVHFLPSFPREVSAAARNGLDGLADWTAFLVAGYGQDARRSLLCLVFLFLAATALAHLTWEEGSFAPNSAVILASPGWATATERDCLPVNPGVCDPNPAETWANTFTTSAAVATQGGDWDSFNRYGYAADLVVPFLDLGQTDAWAPSKDRGAWGWWLWWMRWVLATAGWIVTGLGVAAVTGVMQRNQPD